MAVITIIAAFGLFGLVVVTLVTTILQQAEAVTDRIVTMPFSPGSIVCPNGGVIDENVYMAFNLQKTNYLQFVSGSFAIIQVVDPEADPVEIIGQKEGDITQARIITPNKFRMQGTETFDSLCGASVPTTITISGTCWAAATVEFTAANGEKGTFRAQDPYPISCTAT